MFQLRPGSLAMVIGAQTANGRRNIGKSVELFGLFKPGERFLNPVNGVVTDMPLHTGRALWLVTGDVVSFDGQPGFAFIRAEHLMPLLPDSQPYEQREQVIS